ncbi:MAG: SPOR domain-containing protein [bacterium]|nr:SPOR domain-containing protein [bacterium]MCP4800219.1 SPOR domain-containing protein [bacterium]
MTSYVTVQTDIRFDEASLKTGAEFWNDIEEIISGESVATLVSDLLSDSKQKNWFFVGDKESASVRMVAALAAAKLACENGKSVIVVDADSDASLLSSFADREAVEGWIDMVRYGVSLNYASVELPWSENGRLLGAGSYVPNRPTTDEVVQLDSTLRDQSDIVIYLCDSAATVWRAVAGQKIVCLDAGSDENVLDELAVQKIEPYAVIDINVPVAVEEPVAKEGSSNVLKIILLVMFVIVVALGIWFVNTLIAPGETESAVEVVSTEQPEEIITTAELVPVAVDTMPEVQEDVIVEEQVVEEPVVEEPLEIVEAGYYSAPPAGDSYTFHISSYQDTVKAVAELEVLASNDIAGRYIQCADGWVRVYVGNFPSRELANAEIDSLLVIIGERWTDLKKISDIK